MISIRQSNWFYGSKKRIMRHICRIGRNKLKYRSAHLKCRCRVSFFLDQTGNFCDQRLGWHLKPEICEFLAIYLIRSAPCSPFALPHALCSMRALCAMRSALCSVHSAIRNPKSAIEKFRNPQSKNSHFRIPTSHFLLPFPPSSKIGFRQNCYCNLQLFELIIEWFWVQSDSLRSAPHLWTSTRNNYIQLTIIQASSFSLGK